MKTCAICCGAVAGEVVCKLQLGKLYSSVDVQRHLRNHHSDGNEEGGDHDEV